MARVCGLDELGQAVPLRVVVGGRSVCLVRLDDDVYAIGDTCTHADVSLADGDVDPDQKLIECWKHGSNFSLVTGDPDTLPAVVPVPVYEVRVQDGDVLVEVRS